jgi:hypothetical protein
MKIFLFFTIVILGIFYFLAGNLKFRYVTSMYVLIDLVRLEFDGGTGLWGLSCFPMGRNNK